MRFGPPLCYEQKAVPENHTSAHVNGVRIGGRWWR
jgi:hypothetical protein